ncbi:MAG: IS982 family transposase [Bacteroidetes bacterium]|nr:MAG: IS982 family transposase [Bacteroidota bacterium]
MNDFKANYDKILEILQQVSEKKNFLGQIRKPKLTDIELIAVNLTAEYMSIDSECQLFRILPDCLKSKIERSVYNKRKRKLFPFMELIRQKLSSKFTSTEIYYIVDSMPLEVVKFSRSSWSKICKESYCTSPDKGYCASQKMHYYGYKLHAVCSIDGVFKSFDISKASVHDIHYLKDIKTQFRECVILGDKGYLSADCQLDLFESKRIKLEVPMRKNQKNFKQQACIFRKKRKRIETLFSQLCDQFMIRRNYAKSFGGFKTRILSKITAMTVIQYLNKFVFNRNINNLKVNLT